MPKEVRLSCTAQVACSRLLFYLCTRPRFWCPGLHPSPFQLAHLQCMMTWTRICNRSLSPALRPIAESLRDVRERCALSLVSNYSFMLTDKILSGCRWGAERDTWLALLLSVASPAQPSYTYLLETFVWTNWSWPFQETSSSVLYVIISRLALTREKLWVFMI